MDARTAERLAKLDRLAASRCNRHEADLAAARAAELRARHGVAQAEPVRSEPAEERAGSPWLWVPFAVQSQMSDAQRDTLIRAWQGGRWVETTHRSHRLDHDLVLVWRREEDGRYTQVGSRTRTR
jgi:hypothetical protein